MFGEEGDDRLDRGHGDDVLVGGHGDDHVDGGTGNDLAIGDRGYDKVFGGAGSDILILVTQSSITTSPLSIRCLRSGGPERST